MLLAGDVSENPGPVFVKIVMGSFNQGHQKFGSIAGLQCCAIASYSIAFSVLKSVKYWSSDTLDSIIEQGSMFYKTLGKEEYLGVEDLPDVINIFGEMISIKYERNIYDILDKTKNNRSITEEHIESNTKDNINGCIMWISQTCLSIIVEKQKETHFILTDSHSRDNNGRKCSDGVAVILYFKNVKDLTNYLYNTYVNRSNPVAYQLQFLKCNSTVSTKAR